jgi:hypothetical protein
MIAIERPSMIQLAAKDCSWPILTVWGSFVGSLQSDQKAGRTNLTEFSEPQSAFSACFGCFGF